MTTNPQDDSTHFGYRSVARSEKAGLVKGVFDSVASRYDIMNDVMSGGMHRLWKREMVATLAPTPDMAILDVAGGTGDIAMRIREESRLRHRAAPNVTLCDINHSMLVEGRKRGVDQGTLDGIRWVCGNAEALPFDDASMDAYTIAFGIRNVTNIDKALMEVRRVLKPGGRFLCLEFSQVKPALLAKFYNTYSMQVIPRMGKLVAGDAAPYQYLVESIRQFPNQETFAAMMRDAGLDQVSWQNLTGGVVALHSGWRL